MFEDQSIMPVVRKHNELAKAVLMGVLSLLLIMFAVLPTFDKAQKARVSLQKRKTELRELSEKVVVLSSLDDQVLSERVEVLNRVLPPKKDLTAYLTTLSGMSRELGMSLGEISLNPGDVTDASKSGVKKIASKDSTLSSLETEISLIGREEDAYALLRQIENVAPLMQVKDVAMSSVLGQDSFGLSLRLSMLYSDIDSFDFSKTGGVVNLFDESEERLFQQLTQYRSYSLDEIPYLEPGGVDKEDLFKPPELRLSESLLPQEQDSPLEEPLQESSVQE